MWRLTYVLLLLLHVKNLHCDEFDEFDPLYTSDIKVIYEGNNDDILSHITADIVEECLIEGQKKAREEYIRNEKLSEHGIYLNRNSTGFSRFNTGKLSDKVKIMKKASSVMHKGLEILVNKYCDDSLPPKNFTRLLYKKQFKILGLYNEDTTKKYKLKRYRTYDGSYNNLNNPNWGAVFAAFTRVLSANYADGIKKPAISVLGTKLPSARAVSLKIFNPCQHRDCKLTLLASQIAQMIAHDTHLSVQENIDNGPIRCVTDYRQILPTSKRHTSCMAIPIPCYDPIYGKEKKEYLPFIRSVTRPDENGFLSPAEQINAVTSYLDCGFVYGNSKKVSNSLRTFKNGKLLESSHKNLPLTDSNSCDYRNGNGSCYKAGDVRVNQNPHLVAIHVLLLREHNRIANILRKLNCHWSDERIFQETRRIIIAIYQRIIYKEYLPLMLGEPFIKSLFSTTDENGFTHNYNETINPGSINSMNIIFRCFHSSIPGSVASCNDSCHVLKKFKFSDTVLRPNITEPNFDGILNSFSCLAMKKIEATASKEVTNKLFKSYAKYGLDLLAMDIQRGRDHGISNYNTYRRFSGLPKVSTFKELISDMDVEAVKYLESTYKHVDDIDFMAGAMLEKPVQNTPFGPVILHVLQKQFYNSMVGDRYFYTNKNQTYPFTPEQLCEIEKVTMAILICNNGNKVKSIQGCAFQLTSPENPRIACCELPTMDFIPWIDIK